MSGQTEPTTGTVTLAFGRSIHEPPSHTMEVDALLYGDLAVHKKWHGPSLTEAYEDDWFWMVTHAPSGFAVYTFESEEEARRFAQALRDLDWSGDVQSVVERNREAVHARLAEQKRREREDETRRTSRGS